MYLMLQARLYRVNPNTKAFLYLITIYADIAG